MSSMLPDRPRVVFLDFDGTYAHGGVVPVAHDEAVRRARERGHTVLLCTGRPAAILAPTVIDAFDGAVTSAGAHVRVGTSTLRDDRFPVALGRRSVALLEQHGADFALEAPEALYCSPRSAGHLRERWSAAPRRPGIGEGSRDLVAALVASEDLAACSFAKISVWSSPVGMEELAAQIGPEVGALPNSVSTEGAGSGELHLAAIDKADGIRAVADHLRLPMADTVGIGDGMNDLGMLRAAGTGIAIRTAPEVVRSAADHLAPPPDEHGIAVAFARLGLI